MLGGREVVGREVQCHVRIHHSATLERHVEDGRWMLEGGGWGLGGSE